MSIRLPAGCFVVVPGREAHAALVASSPPDGFFAAGPVPDLPILVARLRAGAPSAVPLGSLPAAVAAAERFRAPRVAFGFVPDADRRDWFDLVVPDPTTSVAFIPQGPDIDLVLPFAVIGDVHGCTRTLDALLATPEVAGRFPVFVGDLIDKDPTGDGSVAALRRVMRMHRRGECLVVRGNHEQKLMKRFLRYGPDLPASALTGPLVRTVAALRRQPDADMLIPEVAHWLPQLPTMLNFSAADMLVVHAAHRPELVGASRTKDRRRLAEAHLYGIKPPKGLPRNDSEGLPIREDWARTYTGDQTIVHGHVVVDEPRCLNGVVNVDTGCYRGARLTAYLSDTGLFVSVPTDPADLAR